MKHEFDFRELTAKAHLDYVGAYFPEWWKKNKTTFVLPSLKNINQANLGKPYYMQLTLQDKKELYTFPCEPLVTISLQKTFVESATIGEQR